MRTCLRLIVSLLFGAVTAVAVTQGHLMMERRPASRSSRLPGLLRYPLFTSHVRAHPCRSLQLLACVLVHFRLHFKTCLSNLPHFLSGPARFQQVRAYCAPVALHIALLLFPTFFFNAPKSGVSNCPLSAAVLQNILLDVHFGCAFRIMLHSSRCMLCCSAISSPQRLEFAHSWRLC